MVNKPNIPRQPSDILLERARAVLHPDDRPGLDLLKEDPTASFSLIRPLLNPGSDVLQPMQEDVAATLSDHRDFPIWWGAGVMRTERLGATFFDGELQAAPNPTALGRANKYMLAVNLCAALPSSATEPTIGLVSKVSMGSAKRERLYLSLGIAAGAALEEYNAVDRLAFRVFGGQYNEQIRLQSRLAFILKPQMSTYIPAASLRERVMETLPVDTRLRLGRVRLTVDSADTSPYVKLK